MTAEGLTSEEIKSRFGYIEGFIKKPKFTDDTILTHLTVSAIINNGLVVDRRKIASTFVKHFNTILMAAKEGMQILWQGFLVLCYSGRDDWD